MKCIVCEKPTRLVEKEADIPVPGPEEALLRILRVGICGTDLHAYQGNQPYFTYPRVLGHELSAEIVEIGENEQGLVRGDLVSVIPYQHCGTCTACQSGKTNCCRHMSVIGVHEDGGMREFMTVPVRHLIRADGLNPDQAAIVECYSIGAHGVRVAGVQPGNVVLVIGAGPIGLGTMKAAKLAGAQVIGMDINEKRLEFCRDWVPCDYIVNGRKDPVNEVKRMTKGEFPSIVLDATGNARSMEQALHFVAHGGRLVYVGLVNADITFHDPDFHKREMAIMGSRNATREDFVNVMGNIRAGRINTDAFITHRTGVSNLIREYDSWLKPESEVIKAVVKFAE